MVVHETRRRQAALSVLQRRRVRTRHLQRPRVDALDAARSGRGLRDRCVRDRCRDCLRVHPRRVHGAAVLDGAGRQGSLRRRDCRKECDGHRQAHRRPRAQRGGSVHLRRRNGAHEFARGKARQSTDQASVPGSVGRFRNAHHHQQRRDAHRRRADSSQRRRLVQEDVPIESEEYRNEVVLGMRQRTAAWYV